MNTGKYWRVAALAAGFVFAGFFTGCGGGGDSGSNNVAPSTLQGKSYNFSPNTGGQTAVSFNSATDYTFQHETGAVEQGTYQSELSGNTWSVKLANTSGGQQVYDMTFANGSSGSFVLHRDGEADRFGPFNERDSAIPAGDVGTTTASSTGTSTGTTSGSTTTSTTSGSTTTGSTTSGTSTGSTTTGTTSGGTTTTTGDTTTGTTSGGTTIGTTGGSTTTSTTTGTTTTGTTSGTTTTGTTTGTTSGSTTSGTSTAYTGFAPVSLAGRVMDGTRTFTSTGTSGQTHVYTFSSGTFHDSDSPEESDGTYTYSANNSTATLHLTYTGPANFVGDKHDLTMTFTSKDNGTFQSTYTRGDGTVITINGNFQFEPIP